MFLTLGFSDIAIVFRTNSYLSVLQTLYQIGKLPPNDKEENFFYSVPAYASNIDWDSIIDHDSLRIYSLISSKNVNKTAKQLSIRNLQSNMHFGQYDFGVDPCQDRERNFTEIKKMLDLPANEHVKYQLSYKFSKYLKEINNE